MQTRTVENLLWTANSKNMTWFDFDILDRLPARMPPLLHVLLVNVCQNVLNRSPMENFI